VSTPPRIWALIGAHAGDNDQVIALAEALGLPFKAKQLTFNGWRRLGPRLLGASLMSLSRASRQMILSEPPPDLTISAGHRSVAVVRALRERSKGRARSIHVGFPRISPAHFDLVIATAQYPVPDHPNLLRIPYALTRVATSGPDPADQADLQTLPAPRSLLIVGGPNLFWNVDETSLLGRLAWTIDEARAHGGSVLVTTSPRTPSLLRQEIGRALNEATVPFVLAEPKKRPSLASLLAAADAIYVTADSISMVSDAIWTGKPVALLPVNKSARGRLAIALNDAVRPGRRLYPQDLRYFWRALQEVGVSEQLAKPRTSTKAMMDMVLKRVRPILEGLE